MLQTNSINPSNTHTSKMTERIRRKKFQNDTKNKMYTHTHTLF